MCSHIIVGFVRFCVSVCQHQTYPGPYDYL